MADLEDERSAHEQLVQDLMRRPGVRAEIERIERDEAELVGHGLEAQGDMVKGKLTENKDVIDIWNSRLVAFDGVRRKWLRVPKLLIAIALVLAVLSFWTWQLLPFAIACFLLGVTWFFAALIRFRHTYLKCPNCGLVPNESVRMPTEGVEWCDHCAYWLRQPPWRS